MTAFALTKGMEKALIAVAGGISRYGGEDFCRSCVTGEKQDVRSLNALRRRGLVVWVSTKYAFSSFLELSLTEAGEKLFRELRHRK
jgi:hypothetical protein